VLILDHAFEQNAGASLEQKPSTRIAICLRRIVDSSSEADGPQ
jgi:hypothetical protein